MKLITFISFVFYFGLAQLNLVQAQTQTQNQINEYYLGVFSNTTNTIKFTIGAYPSSVNQSKRNDGTIYTAMRIAIINNEKAEPIEWSDYKIYILLKDGSLFYNFLTNTTTGDYACKYTVQPGETHLQFVCFEKIFNSSDIDKVWLSFSDNQFLPLFLYKDEIKSTVAEPEKQTTAKPAKK